MLLLKSRLFLARGVLLSPDSTVNTSFHLEMQLLLMQDSTKHRLPHRVPAEQHAGMPCEGKRANSLLGIKVQLSRATSSPVFVYYSFGVESSPDISILLSLLPLLPTLHSFAWSLTTYQHTASSYG